MREYLSDKLDTITGTIKLADGSTSEFMIGRDGGWSQWGATRERLGRSVDIMETTAGALLTEGLIGSSDDEDDEDDDAGDDDTCRVCTGPNDNGEGWDGMCGTCADRAEYGEAYTLTLTDDGGDSWTEEALSWADAVSNAREYVSCRRDVNDADLDRFTAELGTDKRADVSGFVVTITRDENAEPRDN